MGNKKNHETKTTGETPVPVTPATDAAPAQPAKPRKPRASYRAKSMTLLKKWSVSLAKLAKKLDKLPEAVEIATIPTMAEDLLTLVAQIEALPEDWKPARSPRGALESLIVGDHVQVREKSAKNYDGLIAADATLMVTQLRASLIGLTLPDGSSTLLPRAHFKKVATAPEA